MPNIYIVYLISAESGYWGNPIKSNGYGDRQTPYCMTTLMRCLEKPIVYSLYTTARKKNSPFYDRKFAQFVLKNVKICCCKNQTCVSNGHPQCTSLSRNHFWLLSRIIPGIPFVYLVDSDGFMY